MKKLFIIAVVIFGLLIHSMAMAGSNVTFEWDTNDEADLAGYRLWQSTVSGQYDQTQPPAFEVKLGDPGFDHTGDRCQWTLEDVPDGTYYWVLTAFDNETPENESGFSNEVTATIDTTAPGSPSAVTIHVIVKVDVQ